MCIYVYNMHGGMPVLLYCTVWCDVLRDGLIALHYDTLIAFVMYTHNATHAMSKKDMKTPLTEWVCALITYLDNPARIPRITSLHAFPSTHVYTSCKNDSFRFDMPLHYQSQTTMSSERGHGRGLEKP